MPSQQALVTWGQLLANLPEQQVQQLLTIAKQLEGGSTEQAAEGAVELAAVQAAITTHNNSPAPENMFCPFTVVGRDPRTGQLHRQAAPMMHWGNVDTGSMVNIVYSGVLRTFPHLHQYWEDFEHVVKGVGDRLTKVTGKVVGVPVSLGMEQAPGSCIKTTFYVLACDSYHFILGLTLLAAIDGGVYCGSRRLDYAMGPTGGHQRCTVPLATRTTARQSPCYSARPQYTSLGEATPRPAHAQLASIPECWQASCLGDDVLPYVQETLVDVAAWAACNNDTTQYADCFPASLTCTHVDISLPSPH